MYVTDKSKISSGVFKSLSKVGAVKNPRMVMTIPPTIERAKAVLKFYLTDFTEDEIADCVDKAYTKEKFEFLQGHCQSH